METDHGPSDADLMRRLAEGAGEAEAALRLLYDRYAGPLMAFAFHLTWDRSAAEDAVQEAFLRVWRSADRFRAGARLEPWLYRIARNEALDAGARARGKVRGAPRFSDRLRTIDPPEEPAAAPPIPTPEAELSSALQAAIARLPERLRMAFVLVRLGHRSQEDAAQLLDVPVGTIKSRVAAAESVLRTSLRRFA